mmetsp:Transcript_6104/g.10716  ORF Transcript_6104/g.10716 Transcript_6104/m.10716 type:complete len:85 (+) Transcript_6104:373-627(+)|eukprot:CAMPEP_0204900906 /NCGR_PEP_ID=MMETSP1397-20131031/2754_1 /ASSEMBLY_ACC=CAM_ASM_000891 /TAXON_ID=49980 /ORGANISM="Climacostomum Climacostomum virens, Strain Stock W-24" /LENGTH=84 /DNA_ID=CAMNT_0052069145 /DNA_START=339 /DNA_END=593 /DNA_ORIENTATION=+
MADFEQVAEAVRHADIASLSNEDKLELYSLYKQSTEGDVKGSQPWAVQFEARAKWDAWAAKQGLPQDQARENYVKHARAVLHLA